MGSWSVSCGISNIAITSGNKCVLLPLRKNNGDYGYYEYIPATLPIFGEYNDYGGIEDIEKNFNTELIEKVTGVSIEDFCVFLVDGRFTYDRDEYREIKERVSHKKEMDNLRFMWIDRQVYDFMSSYTSSNGFGGCLGYRFILEKLNFTKLNEKVEGRFCNVWEKDGKKIYSDGTWINTIDGKSIFDFDKGYSPESCLSNYFQLTEEEKQFDDLNIFSFYEEMNEEETIRFLLPLLIGRDYTPYKSVEDYEKLREKNQGDEKMLALIDSLISYTRSEDKLIFAEEYFINIEKIKKEFSELGIFYTNLHCMSGTFRPHELYLTPQCGEHREHQVFLEKFAEINKSYIYEEDEY